MRRSAYLAPSIALALVFAVQATSAQTVQEREPWRPPALEPTPICDVYTGTSHGNDPTSLIEMRICAAGGGVTGQAQYSGKQSGWSVRSLAGAWSDGGDVLVIHELAIVDQRPNPGWRFCTVDRYELAKDDATKTLAGTYDSAACHDHATLSLKLTGTLALPSEAGPPAKPALAASAVPPLPGETTSRRACSCSEAGAAEAGAPAGESFLFALGAATLLARRGPRRLRRVNPS